jgi:hypothetical protein
VFVLAAGEFCPGIKPGLLPPLEGLCEYLINSSAMADPFPWNAVDMVIGRGNIHKRPAV